MSDTAEVHIVRVFTDAQGLFGNHLGVVLDGARYDAEAGSRLCAELGFSEVVLVDDRAAARLRVFTPKEELPLAGHPLVGTAWLLGRLGGTPVKTLRPVKAAEVDTWAEDGRTWIRARLADAPEWGLVQLDEDGAVEMLPVPPGPEYDHHMFWAWIDEPNGVMRARCFASRSGIPEDEATGSAAMRQVEALKRRVVVRQGWGSEVVARPAQQAGWVEVGGLVASDGVRTVRF
jgi:predicted PhzF superfamily epimerase YddE/YHI9